MANWIQIIWDIPFLKEIVSFAWWFVVKIIYDKYDNFRDDKRDSKDHDKTIFLTIRDSIVSRDGMEFLRDWNPSDPFETKSISWLMKLIDVHSKNPDLKFLDQKWEKVRLSLFQSIEYIIIPITGDTFPHKKLNWYQWVPREWETEQPERHEQVISEFTKLSKNAWKEYEYFLFYGKSRFKI